MVQIVQGPFSLGGAELERLNGMEERTVDEDWLVGWLVYLLVCG